MEQDRQTETERNKNKNKKSHEWEVFNLNKPEKKLKRKKKVSWEQFGNVGLNCTWWHGKFVNHSIDSGRSFHCLDLVLVIREGKEEKGKVL